MIVNIASKVLGINLENLFKKRIDFQPDCRDAYKKYVMSRIEPDMLVMCNKDSQIKGGNIVGKGMIRGVLSVTPEPKSSLTVKWPHGTGILAGDNILGDEGEGDDGDGEVDQGEVSTIRLGLHEASGFRKYSTLLVIQLFSRRLCVCHCLCIRLCLCICVPYSFLNSYYHKLSENVWVWGCEPKSKIRGHFLLPTILNYESLDTIRYEQQFHKG